jgi:MFS transporter, ACS family, glucarate transporter
VAITTSLAALTYLDRVCISILAPSIMRDLSLSRIQMSYVFSAFTLAYALFEIPTAWWADRIGSRKVITRIVLWWSTFTLATAGAFQYTMMLAVRFLFGVGEAGAWPSAARVFGRWIPAEERGRAQGIFFAGAHFSGGVTPILVTFLATLLPWRALFLLFGCLGFAWAFFWARWFRDEPRDYPGISAAEVELIEKGRGVSGGHTGAWKQVLATRGLAPLCIQYFANSYGFYFFITWLPSYLAKAHGMTSVELATFAGLPLLFSVLADLTGGITTDAISKRFGWRAGRSGVGSVAYFCAAAFLFAGTLMTNGHAAGLFIALGGAASMFSLAPAWTVAVEFGGEHAAVMGAVMNTAGQIGGVLSPLVLAYIVERLGNWNLPLQVLAGLYLAAAISWILIRPQDRNAKRT